MDVSGKFVLLLKYSIAVLACHTLGVKVVRLHMSNLP